MRGIPKKLKISYDAVSRWVSLTLPGGGGGGGGGPHASSPRESTGSFRVRAAERWTCRAHPPPSSPSPSSSSSSFSSSWGSCPPPSSAFELVILHTNDVHARVEETSVHAGRCGGGGGCFGGAARRAAAVRAARSAHAHVLLLDAGDQFQGTVWFSFYRGAEAAHFMNTLGYDAMALGNHEFDNGVGGLLSPFLERVRFPVLSANIRPDAALGAQWEAACPPHAVLRVGGERVGVVGYTSQETPTLSAPGPQLQFGEELAALQRQVDQLRADGVDKIIALGHSGFTVDQLIARRVRGVDVVVGGHSNTFLFNGPPPSLEAPAGPYPFMVTSEDGRRVPVVQAFAFGKYLGQLKVTFDDKGEVVEASGNPILLSDAIPQDPEVLAEVEQWKKSLSNYSAQVVGQTLVFLNGSAQECRFRECNLGNLICDAMVSNSLRSSGGQQWTHAAAAILNGGGIRGSVDELSRNGSVTLEELLAVLPFGGTFDLVTLTGATLKKAFEHSVRRYGQNTGEFLQVSGLRVELDLSRPPGRRLRTLMALCTRCRVPRLLPVRDQDPYRLLMPSYLVAGGDGFSMIPDEMLKHDSGDLDISVVSSYFSQRKKVYPSLEGRIRFFSSSSGPGGPQTAPFWVLVLVLVWVLV
ncbi:snake venom 5'-nucleotidase-like [Menidia menidia]